MVTKELPLSKGYDFFNHQIEPQLCPIQDSGAAVLVNSIGIKATFKKGGVAESLLNSAGEGIRQEVQRHTPLKPGHIVITSAGKLVQTTATRYIFHTVITDRETHYRANPKLVAESTARAVQLADLLGQESIAFPVLGSGFARGKPRESVKRSLNEIITLLPNCSVLKKVIYSMINPETYGLFHNRALVTLALAHSEQQLKASLSAFPPSLYGMVGEMLQRLEAARSAGDGLHTEELRCEAEGLIFLAENMKAHLRDDDPSADRAVQLVLATGGSIIQNVTQQAAGDGATQIGQAEDVTVSKP
jgi:O-acetyl-ADP-ribose deacetylase (regulator of RNase III)